MRKTKVVLFKLAVGILLIFLQPVVIGRQLTVVEQDRLVIVSPFNDSGSFLEHLVKLQPPEYKPRAQPDDLRTMIRGP